ncbi:MAG: hypothetical protein ACYC91_20440 [Solirubrobacteraceae bacterium]
MNPLRSILALLTAVLTATALGACGGGSASSTQTQPSAAGASTSTSSLPATQSPTTPSKVAAGQASTITALANRLAARLGPVDRQCQSTSHSEADFVSCLKGHGVQISTPTGAQGKLVACLKQAHDATALGQCAKLTGAP